jgi:flagellar hook protein FlgE
MIRSLYSGVSGLRNHQTKLDVISNNIANVNTAGYKSQRVIFKDLYYQTMASASAPGAAKGGTNPMQLGYGSKIASIDMINTRSGYQTTDVATDLYISGDGYFRVRDTAGEINYTRVGAFNFDAEGKLVDSSGSIVSGWLDITGVQDETTISNIVIPNIADYTEIAVGPDGTINAIDSSGDTVTLARIALAKFPNPNALSMQGNQYYKQTQNTGEPKYAVPGSDATGSLIANGLEMSNVDLSKEFTDMIVTQRGFQANSRSITTSDEILQELVNLKR